MPLNLASLMFLFCENDNRTPGVFKAFLYHAEFEKKQIKMDCCTDNCILFLGIMKTGLFTSVVTMVTNNISRIELV